MVSFRDPFLWTIRSHDARGKVSRHRVLLPSEWRLASRRAQDGIADGEGVRSRAGRRRWIAGASGPLLVDAPSITTLGVFMSTLDASIVIISVPAIF
jgi:hypothetical protein